MVAHGSVWSICRYSFFFSGYCFKEKYLEHFFLFLKKRIKGLYWPAVKWGLVFLVLHNVFYHFYFYSGNSYLYSYDVILRKASFIILTMTQFDELLGGFWFLRSLFWCSIIGFFVIKYIPPRVGVVALLLMSIGLLVIHKKVPYFDVGAREFMASLIFVCGYLYRKSSFKWEYSKCIFLIGIALITLGTFFWRASMGLFSTMTWWKVLPWLLSAVFGTIAIYALGIRISNCKRLSPMFIFIGEQTLEILTWHLICFKLVSYIIVLVHAQDLSHLADFPVIDNYSRQGWWIAYLLTGCGVPLLFVLIKSNVNGYFDKRNKSKL